MHQLQHVFLAERLQAAQASLGLKYRQCVLVVACCQVVHNEAVHEAAPQGIAAWYCCMNAALLLLELGKHLGPQLSLQQQAIVWTTELLPL